MTCGPTIGTMTQTRPAPRGNEVRMNNRKITNKIISYMSRQSLKTSRMRNMFVMITIILASALLTGILAFAMGQEEQNRRELAHRQQVSFYNLTEEQVEALREDERLSFQIQVKTGVPAEIGSFNLLPCYVSELSDEIRVGSLEDGTLPQQDNEVAVCAAALRKMGLEPQVGSSVTFSFYDGSVETFTVSGIPEGSEEARQYTAFFSQGYAEHGSQLSSQPYEVYAKLRDIAYLSARECKELMYQIGWDQGIEREYVNPSKAFLDSLSPDAQILMLCALVGVVILLACALVIYGVFYLSVIGRIHQFGQLRTLGMTAKQMKRMVSREGGMLFVRSAPIGICVGTVVGYGLVPGGFSIYNMVTILIATFAIIYAITMISVHRPARIAATVSPMEALRYVPQDGMRRASGRRLCRRLTPMGLAAMNFSRNKKKAAITMLSLALGGILFMTAATYLSSFDQDGFARQGNFKNAEFHIHYTQAAVALSESGSSGLQARTPMDEDMVMAILSLDGVKKVEQIKSFGVSYDFSLRDEYAKNDTIYLMTEEETRGIGQYLEAGSADCDKLMSGDYILATDNRTVQEIYGWQFQPGDQITLHYYDGHKSAEKEVVILGILSDSFVLEHSSLEGWFIMPEQAILDWLEYDTLNSGLLVSVDEAREAAVEEALETLLAQRPELEMETLAERRVVYAQNANRIFGAISGLAVFIMMFSILSMMNTLITNIVTRRQELAMLESIGMGARQLRGMLLGESLLLVLVTVGVTMTAGTLCGYMLSRMLYRAGAFYMAFRFPTGLALAYGAVLTVVPILITLILMHRFAKDTLVERLRGMENG